MKKWYWPIMVVILMVLSPMMALAEDVKQNEKNYALLTKTATVQIISVNYAKWSVPSLGDTCETFDGGSGSGVCINPNGYIVTNAHVVEASKLDEQEAKKRLFAKMARIITNKHDVPLTESNISYLLSHADIIEFKRYLVVLTSGGDRYNGEIKAYGAPVGQGKDVAVVKVEVKNFPSVILDDSDKVQVQDKIVVIGYPVAAESDILSKESILEPSVTEGTISAKKTSAQGAPILQVSAAATHGNSGGPVINQKNGQVVGLLTFRGDTVNGQEVQGFNFVVPSNTVKEFIRQAGTENTQGIVDQKYKEGLAVFQEGYYSEAMKKLQEVVNLSPGHRDAKKLLADAQQAVAEGKDKKRLSNYLPYIGGAVLLVVVVVIVILVLRKKKAKDNVKILPAQPMQDTTFHDKPMEDTDTNQEQNSD